MSYDPRQDALLALAIAMSTGNASEGLEAVERANQNTARSLRRLPKKMRPNQAAFEAVGFSFSPIEGDDVLCQATVPDGWTFESDGGYWTTIYDEKGRSRASYFYKGAFWDRDGHMDLHRRFQITSKHVDPQNWESPCKVCVIDAAGSIIFDAGQCSEMYSPEYDALYAKAEEYLSENYPDWKDPTKYWD